jgi:hypothetical protein
VTAPSTDERHSRLREFPAIHERELINTDPVGVDSIITRILLKAHREGIRAGIDSARSEDIDVLGVIESFETPNLATKYAGRRVTIDCLYKAVSAHGFVIGLTSIGDLSSDQRLLRGQLRTVSSILQAKAFCTLDEASQRRVIALHSATRDSRLRDSHLRVWKDSCVGAVSVALTVHALNSIGHFDVYLPTLHEDMRLKIDLIAQFRGMESGLVLQIKTDGRRDARCYVVRNRAEMTDEDRAFMHGHKWFSRSMEGFWIPINLATGNKGLTPVERRKKIAEVVLGLLKR